MNDEQFWLLVRGKRTDINTAARSVLVDGDDMASTVRNYGISYDSVYAAVHRIKKDFSRVQICNQN